MKRNLVNLNSILKKYSDRCDFLSVRRYSELTTNIMVRDERLDQFYKQLSDGVMFEVLIDGQFSYGSTNDLSEKNIEEAFLKAINGARNSKKYPLFQFDTSFREKNNGKYLSSRKIDLENFNTKEIIDTLISSSDALKTPNSRTRMSGGIIVDTKIDYVASNGSEWSQDFNLCTRYLSNTVSKDGIVQSRSNGMPAKQVGLEFFDQKFLIEEAEKIKIQSEELLVAKDLEEGQMDLVLAPDQLYLQVHESIGHPLELDRILGDERNYAGWSFVKKDDFGSLEYGSNLLNVTFDPCLESEMASYEFDDSGRKATKEYLIKEGKLLRGIGSTDSERRLGVPGIASSRSSDWNRAPIDRMGNINIEPGTTKLEDMISSIENGVLMETNRSWSIDDFRNKFQFGCEYAKRIRNGEVAEVVRNPNYKGISSSFWKSLSAVGDNDSFEIWGSPFCGKGEPNQVIRVGHSIPYCKFDKVEVFGGGN